MKSTVVRHLVELLLVVFIPFCVYSQITDKTPDTKDSELKNLLKADLGRGWNTWAICQNTKIRPIKFTKRTGNTLDGDFLGKYMKRRFQFSVDAGAVYQGIFWEVDGKWEKQVRLKDFLEDCKDSYWLVTFIPPLDNFIISAHQFKDWEALKFNFAQDPDNASEGVETEEFWDKLTPMSPLITEIKDDKIYWVFFSPILADSPIEKSDSDVIELENNMVSKRRTSFNGAEVKLTAHGVLLLHKNCVFHGVETRRGSEKLIKVPLLSDKTGLRIRAVSINEAYLRKNYLIGVWILYYNEDSKVILRAININNDMVIETQTDKTVEGKDKQDKK